MIIQTYTQTNEKGQHFYIDKEEDAIINSKNDTNIVSTNQRTISSINLNGQSYDINVPSIDAEIQKIWERLNTQVSLVHNCANCGATLEIEENKPVFHCKYCGSTYIIGPAQLNSHY